MSIHQPEPIEWVLGTVIACIAPDVDVMCAACLAPIPAGSRFDVLYGRAYHAKCPPARPHLRLVPTTP